MTDKKWNSILLFSFLLILFSILIGGNYYKEQKAQSFYHALYSKLTVAMINKVETLISEKKNATLTISLSQSKNTQILDALSNNADAQRFLQDLSLQLRKETDFKNVWFQIINKDGISIARSWSDKEGDDLSLIREDIRSMKNKPMIKSSVSVGKFDMSFKAMVPIFSKEGKFIGIFETITHFNSIAKKVNDDGFYSVILVDKKYKKQLSYPFTKLFIGDNYVANNSADKYYMDLIASRGIESFKSKNDSYVIDSKSANMVINYTLFDSADLPMANFFMFKPLEKIDTASINIMRSMVNLFMLFGSVVILFLFMFLFKRELNSENYDNEKVKYVLGFSFLLIVLTVLYHQFLYWNYKSNQDDYLKNYNKNIERNFNIIHEKFNTIADATFETILNTKEISDIIWGSYKSDDLKDESRKKLFNLLIDKYEYLKTLNIRQLHFHLKNNESFLRFHRPKKYGDNLTEIRATVKWVNENFQPISGFEEGRIYNGFRNVFPISYEDYKTGKKHHIGSVETSFSPYAIIHEFIKSHGAKAAFIISSDVVKAKVFNNEQSNYKNGDFKNFYTEVLVHKQLDHAVKYIEVESIDSKDLELANKKIFEGEIFSLLSKDENHLFTFIPVKNPVSKKVVAAIILQLDNVVLKEQKENFFLMLIIGISSLIVVVLFVYREYISKIKLKESSLKTQQILDTQDSIVITTDAEELLDANKKFLDFFGNKSVLEFQKYFNCICDRFEKNDSYFHLDKLHTQYNWIEHLSELPFKERIVLMKDSNGEAHSFAVSFSVFGKDDYVVTFTDISQTIEDNIELEEKVVRDKLTGAYNREFFENRITHMMDSCKIKGECSGLIILDIDHFKSVNDTYGHNRGDIILKELTNCIQSSIRKNDYLIRWGGEEFIVICSTDSIDAIKNVAEHLRSKIEQLSLEEIGHITCSFGAIVINADEDIVQNIERADKALYEAKDSGRNKVVVG